MSKKKMATRVNPNALPHIQRFRRKGADAPWVITRPVLDAIVGSIIIAAVIGGFLSLWIAVGAL